MASNKLINATIFFLALIAHGTAYIIAASTETSNKLDKDLNIKEGSKLTEADDIEYEHITRLVSPSEIRLPTIEQLMPYVVASPAGQSMDNSEKIEPKEEVPKDENTIKYSDLYKILALWQLENEKNYYDMNQTGATTQDDAGNGNVQQPLLKLN